MSFQHKQPAAPECSVGTSIVCFFVVQLLSQVCLDEMVPPTKIFNWVNGHHICETCKLVVLIGIVKFFLQNDWHVLKLFKNQVGFEPAAVSKVQEDDHRKSFRHGELFGFYR